MEEQAQHPFAYEQSLGNEKPYSLNFMYYKDQQLLNPLERILEVIPGFSKEYLGELLGIKTSNVNLDSLEGEVGLNQEYFKVREIELPLIYDHLDLNMTQFAIPCDYCSKLEKPQHCYGFANCFRQQSESDTYIDNRAV